MEYKFIKDYKNIDGYRTSFNDLAKRTFGIDFEQWYQQGFWNDNYIGYSYLDHDQVIANVSLNTMELIIEGEIQKAIQIGTVMTEPQYRRQGLAHSLMKKVLEDYDQVYELYFLAADTEAIPLYEKCGFRANEENKYIIDVQGYRKLETPLKSVEISAPMMMEIKKNSCPLSNVLSAVKDEHVLMFYYTLGFKNAVYRPLEDVYTIFEIEEDELHLYDILSPQKVNLYELIELITPSHVRTVFCHFTPDQPVKGLNASIDSSSNWMIRTTTDRKFPDLARFPRISQT